MYKFFAKVDGETYSLIAEGETLDDLGIPWKAYAHRWKIEKEGEVVQQGAGYEYKGEED